MLHGAKIGAACSRWKKRSLRLQRIHAVHQGVEITLEFDEDVYQPGSLTETLADLMEINPGDRVADVGCGTGYLGITAALLGAEEVICIDPEPNAIRWTNHNAGLNKVHNVTTYLGKELDPVEHLPLDVIVTLPPQMPFSSNFNPWRYGGRDGSDVIIKIIRQAARVLNPVKGKLFLLHAALAFPAKVRETLSMCNFEWQVVKTVERELNPSEFYQLEPGLMEYILDLYHAGKADLIQRGGHWYYPIWFYRAVLSRGNRETQDSRHC